MIQYTNLYYMYKSTKQTKVDAIMSPWRLNETMANCDNINGAHEKPDRGGHSEAITIVTSNNDTI